MSKRGATSSEAIAFECKQGTHASLGVTPTLRSMGGPGSNQPSGGHIGVVVAYDLVQVTSPLDRRNPRPGDPCSTLNGRGQVVIVPVGEGIAVPFDDVQITHPANRSRPEPGDPSPTLNKDGRVTVFAVRTAQTGANGLGVAAEVAHTLDGAKGQAVAGHVVAFSTKESGKDATMDLAPPLRAESGDPHMGGRMAVAGVIITDPDGTRWEQLDIEAITFNAGARTGFAPDPGGREASGTSHTIDATRLHCVVEGQPIRGYRAADLMLDDDNTPRAIAFTERTRAGVKQAEWSEELAYALANPGAGGRADANMVVYVFPSHFSNHSVELGDVSPTLTVGSGQDIPSPPAVYAFSWQQGGAHPTRPPTMNLMPEQSPALSANQVPAVVGEQPYMFKPSHFTRGKDGAPSEVSPPLSADADKGDQDPVVFDPTPLALEEPVPPLVARSSRGQAQTLSPGHHTDGHMVFQPRYYTRPGKSGGAPATVADITNAHKAGDSAPHVTTIAPRRLTPVECARLQGFPDTWLDVPGASDSAKYRALGNAVAVPCVRWIARALMETHAALGYDDERDGKSAA